MKHNIFNDIYHKNLKLDFKDLTVNIPTVESEEKSQQDSLSLKEASNDEIESLFVSISNKVSNTKDELSELEKQIVDEQLVRNRVEAATLRKALTKTKEEIIEKSKDKAFILDISNSQMMRKAANNIFGGNKKTITYDDYLVLLE